MWAPWCPLSSPPPHRFVPWPAPFSDALAYAAGCFHCGFVTVKNSRKWMEEWEAHSRHRRSTQDRKDRRACQSPSIMPKCSKAFLMGVRFSGGQGFSRSSPRRLGASPTGRPYSSLQ